MQEILKDTVFWQGRYRTASTPTLKWPDAKASYHEIIHEKLDALLLQRVGKEQSG